MPADVTAWRNDVVHGVVRTRRWLGAAGAMARDS
jgi:hypothetical protein